MVAITHNRKQLYRCQNTQLLVKQWRILALVPMFPVVSRPYLQKTKVNKRRNLKYERKLQLDATSSLHNLGQTVKTTEHNMLPSNILITCLRLQMLMIPVTRESSSLVEPSLSFASVSIETCLRLNDQHRNEPKMNGLREILH